MLMTIEANGEPILITSQDREDFDFIPETEEALRSDFYRFGIPDEAELSFREPFDEERDRWMRSAHEAIKDGQLHSIEEAYESWAVWLVPLTPQAIEDDLREIEDDDDEEPVVG